MCNIKMFIAHKEMWFILEQERYSFDVDAPGRSWDGIYPFG